jgi:hypothetical protein
MIAVFMEWNENATGGLNPPQGEKGSPPGEKP